MFLPGVTSSYLIEFAQLLFKAKEVWLVETYDLLEEDFSTMVFDDEMSAISCVSSIGSDEDEDEDEYEDEYKREFESLEGIYRVDLSKRPIQVEELTPSLNGSDWN